MARPQLILPQADPACGKLFFSDRHTADAHRIAMEVWNRATGRTRDGYRLAVFRCRRCGGFHLGQRPIVTNSMDESPCPDRAVEAGLGAWNERALAPDRAAHPDRLARDDQGARRPYCRTLAS
jgi:hypothetical protein